MKSTTRYISTLLLTALCCWAYGQKGPGGVSIESGGQSTCRIWLDASTLTAVADGDSVTEWADVSLSDISDNAVPEPGGLPPFFRDDPANTINGYPVVTFEEDRFMLLNSSTDLNLGGTTTAKTVFFSFRTGTDVSNKQVLYEEGGCFRGFNVYVHQDSVHIGGYDFNPGGVNNNDGTTDGDGTPQWGYAYVSKKIESSSTYILTVQFSAPSGGAIYQNNPEYFIKGWLNGQVFDDIRYSNANFTTTIGTNTGINGIGTIAGHPDPIGLGAINNAFVDKSGFSCNVIGEDYFQGRLAELCYYNLRLEASQRILIENYLGAKYFANIIQNDKYDHQANYGNEVIGIGQLPNNPGFDPDLYHNVSQGRNPFQIEATNVANAFSTADRFFLTGHNGQNPFYTNSGVPESSPNIERLQRIWRIDERNNFPEVTLTVDEADLPAKPAGFSKLVLLIDETSPNFPNFSLSNTKVLEMRSVSATTYDIDYNFQDNSFFTLAWLKPSVQFELSEAFGLEIDPLPDSSLFSVNLKLNFIPNSDLGNTYTIDYFFEEITATANSDFGYDYSDQTIGATFAVGQDLTTIDLYVKNDLDAEDPSTESFLLILENGFNSTANLLTGSRDTLKFSVYDDDPPPKASFSGAASTVSEGDPAVLLTVVRTGDNTGTSVVNIKRKAAPNEGTSTYGEDYTCQTADGWTELAADREIEIVFAPGVDTETALVTILDDDVNEADETIEFIIIPQSNISVDAASIIEHTVTLVDEDPEPNAAYLADNQTGYESVGDPAIFIELDRPSTRDVTVYYSITGGTATGGTVDYTAAVSGPILIEAGDTLAFIEPFSVSNADETPEANETIIFDLDSAENAGIGATNQHTYTIIDTSPFQWKGASGVGKDSDNIVWIDADRMSGAGDKQSLTNFSPRDIDVVREADAGSEAELAISVLNGRNAINYRGGDVTTADSYIIDDNSFTNLAGFVEKKSYFFVIQPDFVPLVLAPSTSDPDHTNCALIYEQGGAPRGLSIYLYNGHLWFHAWNSSPNGPQSPWGYNPTLGTTSAKLASTVWAKSAQPIEAGTPYVVSCHYDNFSNEPLKVYVNGEEGESSPSLAGDPANAVGRLYLHGGDIGLGAVTNATRFHFSTTAGGSDRNAAFDGLMPEFIKFHEPQMTEARRIILENYLSAKYNIALFGGDTEQVFDLAFSTGTMNFNEEVAGAGRTIEEDYHGDSQGTAVLRVQNPVFTTTMANGFIMWGHNGETLTNTWPFSYNNAVLPEAIEERSGQVWRFFESPGNPIATTDLLINFSSSDNAQDFTDDTSLLKLLVSTDPEDFSSATVYDVDEVRSGFVAVFSDIPVSDGMYIALGNSSPIGNSPLPIELLSFDAKLKGSHVDLTWSTATEQNNDHFVVERAGENMVWEGILIRAGAGNSNTRIDYSAKDRDPLTGISYYRLKQVDFNGDFTYSQPVAVLNNAGNDYEHAALYPNPSRQGSVFIETPTRNRNVRTEIRLFDMSSKLIAQDRYVATNQAYLFNYGDIQPGIYVLHLQSEAVNESIKLIVER